MKRTINLGKFSFVATAQKYGVDVQTIYNGDTDLGVHKFAVKNTDVSVEVLLETQGREEDIFLALVSIREALGKLESGIIAEPENVGEFKAALTELLTLAQAELESVNAIKH